MWHTQKHFVMQKEKIIYVINIIISLWFNMNM